MQAQSPSLTPFLTESFMFIDVVVMRAIQQISYRQHSVCRHIPADRWDDGKPNTAVRADRLTTRYSNH